MRISTAFNDSHRVEVESAAVCVGVEIESERALNNPRNERKNCVKIEMKDMIRREDVFFFEFIFLLKSHFTSLKS